MKKGSGGPLPFQEEREGGQAESLSPNLRSKLERRAQVERAADLGLEQRVFARAIHEQRVALIREVLRLEDQREVVAHVPRCRRIDEEGRLVATHVTARRCRQRADVRITIRTRGADAELPVVVE